jgi:hypothetical protein
MFVLIALVLFIRSSTYQNTYESEKEAKLLNDIPQWVLVDKYRNIVQLDSVLNSEPNVMVALYSTFTAHGYNQMKNLSHELPKWDKQCRFKFIGICVDGLSYTDKIWKFADYFEPNFHLYTVLFRKSSNSFRVFDNLGDGHHFSMHLILFRNKKVSQNLYNIDFDDLIRYDLKDNFYIYKKY